MDQNNAHRRLIVFVALVCLSGAAMFVDHHTQVLQGIRNGISVMVDPLRRMSAASLGLGAWFANRTQPQDELRDAYKSLQRDTLVMQSKLQKYQSIEAENKRLSSLLGASSKTGYEVLLAELIEVSLEPFTHRVAVNRGSDDGVYVGQPVIDSLGIMGQVTRVTPQSSAITLLTDADHAIPVQVRRNGLRAIVYGVGHPSQLSVPHLPPQASIREGDVLVTSGLGGRFPPGHPVASVARIVRNANEPFLLVDALPIARLDYAKNVLLIWPGSTRGDRDESAELDVDQPGPVGTNNASGEEVNGS